MRVEEGAVVWLAVCARQLHGQTRMAARVFAVRP